MDQTEALLVGTEVMFSCKRWLATSCFESFVDHLWSACPVPWGPFLEAVQGFFGTRVTVSQVVNNAPVTDGFSWFSP